MSSSPNAEAVRARRRLDLGGRREAAVARAIAHDRVVQALALVTVLGAVLRFATLDARGYWVDEAATLDILDQSLWSMLADVLHRESSPPGYFVLAWLWTNLFGSGEVGLRSLTALAGTATIPVVYGVAATLCSRRIGLAAALLASVSPLLVWHAQDARPYALLVLFSALSLFFFARALDNPRGWVLVGWVVASVLAVATSYLTAFLVVAEGAWLLVRHRRRREIVLALGSVGAAGLALMPFALEQQSNQAASWIGDQSLPLRLVQIPAQFVVGYQPPLQRTSVAVLGVLVLAGLWLLVSRARESERRGAWIAGALGLVSLAGPLALALAGLDGLITRTVTAAWVPLVVVVAAGLAAHAAGRTGLVLLGALAALSLTIVLSTADDPKFEREDWRGAAAAVGPVAERAIVLSPENGSLPFRYYRPADRELDDSGQRVTEIVLVGFGPEHRTIGKRPEPPRPPTVDSPAPGFTQVERIEADTYTLVRFRASDPVLADASLRDRGLGPDAIVLIEGRTR